MNLRALAAVSIVATLLPTVLFADGPKPMTGLRGGPDMFSGGVAVNDAGQVVAGANLWTSVNDPAPIQLGTLGSANRLSEASGINNSGQVVGAAYTSSDALHAFLRSAQGVMTDLGTLGGASSHAVGISDAGHVVGHSELASGAVHAFLWTASAGLTDLGTLGGASSHAVAVNSTGHVVGRADTASGAEHAFLWTPSGGMVDLGTLGGPTSAARDINGSGTVVGSAVAASGRTQAFVWTSAGGMVEMSQEDDGVASVASAVNDAGQVVGTMTSGGYFGDAGRFVWTPASGLAALAQGNAPAASASDINSNGLIVGVGYGIVPRFGLLFRSPVFWRWSWDDELVNLGPSYGLWMLGDRGTSWQWVHPMPPSAMGRGDLDGNGQDDLVLEFGPGVGVWVWMNHSTWFQLTSMSANAILVANLDGIGQKEAVLSIPGYGLWTWALNGSAQWRQLNPNSVSRMAICQGESGGDNLAAAFPGQGLWLTGGVHSWTQIHDQEPSLLLCANAQPAPSPFHAPLSQVVAGFPGAGLWAYGAVATFVGPYPSISYVWKNIHPFDVQHVAAGDLDGKGTDDLVIDFGPQYGLWMHYNDASWTPLHSFSAQDVGTADLDGIGGDEVIVNFGPPHGLWAYSRVAGWRLLHDYRIYGILTGLFH